jgi:SepF-like predicted cell division protein (DUF552 family)
MPFNLFHRKKAEPEQEQPVAAPVEEAPPQTETEETPKTVATVIEENSTVSEESSVPAQEVVAPEPTTQPELENPGQEQTQPKPEPETQTPEPPAAPVEQPSVEQPPTEQSKAERKQEQAAKTYLKAMPLKDLQDVVNVKEEVSNGNIIILRITPLAGKSIEDVKKAVNDLFEFAESSGGDIARLGEERVVVCPKTVRIWREKTPAPVGKKEPLPTAA